MEVYIEDIFLDNLIIDFLILYITNILLKNNTAKWKMLLAAFAGVMFVVLNLFVQLSGALLFGYKFLTAVLMILIAFKFKTCKNFFLTFFVFLILTAAMGGFCFFITMSFGRVIISSTGNINYELGLPVSIVLLVVCLIGFLLTNIVKAIKIKNLNNQYIFDVEIVANNKKLAIKGFLDTGNTLTDPITGKPVCIVAFSAFQKLFKDVLLTTLLLKKIPDSLKNAHYVKVGSVGKSSEILVFEVENINIMQNKSLTTKKQNCCLGISFAKLEAKLGCNLLLNPMVFMD